MAAREAFVVCSSGSRFKLERGQPLSLGRRELGARSRDIAAEGHVRLTWPRDGPLSVSVLVQAPARVEQSNPARPWAQLQKGIPRDVSPGVRVQLLDVPDIWVRADISDPRVIPESPQSPAVPSRHEARARALPPPALEAAAVQETPQSQLAQSPARPGGAAERPLAFVQLVEGAPAQRAAVPARAEGVPPALLWEALRLPAAPSRFSVVDASTHAECPRAAGSDALLLRAGARYRASVTLDENAPPTPPLALLPPPALAPYDPRKLAYDDEDEDEDVCDAILESVGVSPPVSGASGGEEDDDDETDDNAPAPPRRKRVLLSPSQSPASPLASNKRARSPEYVTQPTQPAPRGGRKKRIIESPSPEILRARQAAPPPGVAAAAAAAAAGGAAPVLELLSSSDESEEDDEDEDDPTRRILATCETLGAALAAGKALLTDGDDGVTLSQAVGIRSQADLPGFVQSPQLTPYQLVGVNWLALLQRQGINGVLADEMGLGKTVQTIAFLTYATTRLGMQRHLIIVPASVVANWARELARFSPELQVLVYQGAQRERAELRKRNKRATATFNVLLTTYSYFERNGASDDRAFLNKFEYGYLVLDEGHSIKSSSSSRFQRIARIESSNRLLLTGTPIQNNASELVTLLTFLMPAVFGGGEHEGLGVDGLRAALQPFVLRRLKRDVLRQLVPKTVRVERMPLGAEQRAMYDAAKAKHRAALAAGHGLKGQNVWVQLRKICNHPLLVRHRFDDDAVRRAAPPLLYAGAFGSECTLDMVLAELLTYSDAALHALGEQYGVADITLPDDALLGSAKFQFLARELPRLQAAGHRPLLFSQWTSLLDLMEPLLQRLGLRYLRLDGSTAVAERQALIDQFQADAGIFAFLLSTRAGGMGLNLTAADTVILHDMDFNPQVDRQAEDRCHRMGQTRPVTVIKLVCEDSVDTAILELCQSKVSLGKRLLDDEEMLRAIL